MKGTLKQLDERLERIIIDYSETHPMPSYHDVSNWLPQAKERYNHSAKQALNSLHSSRLEEQEGITEVLINNLKEHSNLPYFSLTDIINEIKAKKIKRKKPKKELIISEIKEILRSLNNAGSGAQNPQQYRCAMKCVKVNGSEYGIVYYKL